jgi:hypothetical protein
MINKATMTRLFAVSGLLAFVTVYASASSGADWWLFGGHSSYASDPLREAGYYAGVSMFESYAPVDVEAGISVSTLAYKPEAVQSASTLANMRLAMAPGSGGNAGVVSQARNAPGFGSGMPSGGSGSGNGLGAGGLRAITVHDLEQNDFTFALGRVLGSNYIRGGLHWVSANEAAIDGSYSGFAEWQYTRPHDYFLRLGLASGKRLDGDIRASQYEITAGKEFGNPVLDGVWRLQLDYLVGDNDWSGVGRYRADSIEADAAWSKGHWQLDASLWQGERMYALLNRGYYMITQQDLLTGGYRLGATYRMGSGSLQLFYEFNRLEPAADMKSELSTVGVMYQWRIK